MTTNLSPTEARIASFLGKERNRVSLLTKTNARRDPNQTDEDMNIQAVGAELAVAKYLNVYPDLTIREGDLPKKDLALRSQGLEVKWNSKNADLLVPHLDKELSYVLVYGRLPDFNLIGYLEGRLIPDRGEWARLPYGSCWRVPPGRLKAVEQLSQSFIHY